MSTTTPSFSASSSPTPAAGSRAAHNWIRRIRVDGGYLAGLDVEFTPGGNVACGAPGTGKSTMLALLRFALALPVPRKKKEDFDALIATNLGAGRVWVTLVSSHGTEQVISRSGGEATPRIDSPSGVAWSPNLNSDLFPMRFAGHGELEMMATDGLARLELLSRFAWDDVVRLRTELARVREELNANAAPLVRLDREIAALAKKSAALPAERARLEALKEAAGGDPLDLGAANERKALRERERMMLEGAERELAWLHGEMGVFVATARRRVGQVADAQALRGPNAPLLAEVGATLQQIGGDLESMAGQTADRCAQARAVLAEKKRVLAGLHATEDDAYRALLAKHEHNTGRAFERLTLEKTVAELTKAADEQKARAHERRQLLAARDALRIRQRATLKELTELLERTAERVTAALGERVRVLISPEADRGKYRALLGEILKGKRFDKEHIDLVASSIVAEDLCAQVLAGDASVLEDKLGSKAIAMRMAAVLLDSPRVYELETVDIPDVPTIELFHGKKYKMSHTLSSGQRMVAFVSILLLDRRGPLVVDQPEDNVANKYLAEHLCNVLATAQKDHQFIFVTHNGNVAILGRVERVFEFDADGERGWVAARGTAREVLGAMENNFEGGRPAFVTRKEFYGVR